MSEQHKNVRPKRYPVLLIGGATTAAVAMAAGWTATRVDQPGIGITAWVAVAVVGTATMISAMKNM